MMQPNGQNPLQEEDISSTLCVANGGGNGAHESSINVFPSSCFKYSKSKWKETTMNEDYVNDNSKNTEFRVAHLNVLYPAVEFLTQPNVRYKHLLNKLLPDLLADVYCFNEATDRYLEIMKSFDWVRDGCYISHLNKTPNKKHEVMICAKRPFRCYRCVTYYKTI